MTEHDRQAKELLEILDPVGFSDGWRLHHFSEQRGGALLWHLLNAGYLERRQELRIGDGCLWRPKPPRTWDDLPKLLELAATVERVKGPVLPDGGALVPPDYTGDLLSLLRSQTVVLKCEPVEISMEAWKKLGDDK